MSSTSDPPLLAARAVDVSVAGLPVCRGLDLAIEPGQCWALLGRNGVGKTTLLHTLAGLGRADAGEIRLLGHHIQRLGTLERARRRGLLPQDDEILFPASVLECALAGRFPHLGRWGWEGPVDLALARQALSDLGLAHCEARDARTLSGGERRRLGIATLLAQQPRLALLDEPSNHLDPAHQIAVLGLLRRRFATEDRAALMVLHDINLALRFSDHMLLLFGAGRWRAGPTGALTDAGLLEKLYGHPMAIIAGPSGPLAVPA